MPHEWVWMRGRWPLSRRIDTIRLLIPVPICHPGPAPGFCLVATSQMCALGHKRTFREVSAMSALPPKADIAQRTRHVR